MDIFVENMPPILPEVNGDAVSSGLLALQCDRHGIGFAVSGSPETSFTKGGDVVDVDSKFEHAWDPVC